MEKSKELLKKHGMKFYPGHHQWRNEKNVAWKMDERPGVNWSCKVEDSKMEAVRTEHIESAGKKKSGMNSATNENVLTLLNFRFWVQETKLI